MSESSYEGWAVVELMGHRRLAGRVSEVQQFGATMLRLDVPDAATQFYGGGSIYALTPCDETTARRVAAALQKPAPVQPWELPRLPAPQAPDDAIVDEGDPGDFEEDES